VRLDDSLFKGYLPAQGRVSQIYPAMTTFAAIAFENANNNPDSACVVELVVVKVNRIVRRAGSLSSPIFMAWDFGEGTLVGLWGDCVLNGTLIIMRKRT
jgi:hypothetical protein